MIMRLKKFYDSLNIAAILAPGGEFFSAKRAKSPLAFTE